MRRQVAGLIDDFSSDELETYSAVARIFAVQIAFGAGVGKADRANDGEQLLGATHSHFAIVRAAAAHVTSQP
jgi:hypothetical protein